MQKVAATSALWAATACLSGCGSDGSDSGKAGFCRRVFSSMPFSRGASRRCLTICRYKCVKSGGISGELDRKFRVRLGDASLRHSRNVLQCNL